MPDTALPMWTQRNFYGGYSDDRFMGVDHSFRYAKGVETRKNPNSLTLAYAVEKDSGSVVTDLVLAFITIKSTGDIIAFGSTGKIYRKAGGAGAWVNVYTDSGNAAILNGIEYNGYLYWATSGNLHRIAIGDIDADWTGDVTEDYKAFAVGNSNAHPMIELNNNLYIGDSYYLAELDSLATWTNDKISIFNDEEIRSITYAGSMMRIFSRRSDKVDYGAKYFWNAVSTEWNEKIEYIGQTIHCAINDGVMDYVIAGKRPFLYVTEGYQKQILKRLPLVFDTESCFISPNAIDIYDNLIVFGPAESGSTASIPRGVWTYGREDDKYPNSLNFDYPTSNDNTTDVIGAVHQSDGVLYFSWYNGSTYGIDVVNKAKYRATGELHSRVMYGNQAKEVKTLEEASMAFDTLATGEKIQCFLRKNLETNWEASAEITAQYSDIADRNVNYKELDRASDIGNFNFLETRIILTAGDGQLTTPELCDLSIVYDPLNEESD